MQLNVHLNMSCGHNFIPIAHGFRACRETTRHLDASCPSISQATSSFCPCCMPYSLAQPLPLPEQDHQFAKSSYRLSVPVSRIHAQLESEPWIGFDYSAALAWSVYEYGTPYAECAPDTVIHEGALDVPLSNTVSQPRYIDLYSQQEYPRTHCYHAGQCRLLSIPESVYTSHL